MNTWDRFSANYRNRRYEGVALFTDTSELYEPIRITIFYEEILVCLGKVARFDMAAALSLVKIHSVTSTIIADNK